MTDGRGMGFIRRCTVFTMDLVILSRPVASLCAGTELLAGAQLTRHSGSPPADVTAILREGIAIALVTAAVNTVNDIRDVDADAISQPLRPLPAGRLPASAAWLLASIQALAAVTLSVGVPAGPAVTLVLLSIGIAYSYVLKGTVLAGNLVVALLAATPVAYGAWLVGAQLVLPLLATLCIFWFMFSYEVLKTIRDVIADGTVGYQTVSTQWGTRPASAIFRGALTMYGVIAAVSMLFFGVSAYYIVFMCLGAVPSLAAGMCLPVDRSPRSVRQVLHVMAVSWIPGLAAMFLAFKG